MGWEEEEKRRRAAAVTAEEAANEPAYEQRRKIDEFWQELIRANDSVDPAVRCSYYREDNGGIKAIEGKVHSLCLGYDIKCGYCILHSQTGRAVYGDKPLICFDIARGRLLALTGTYESYPSTRISVKAVAPIVRNLCTGRQPMAGVGGPCFVATAVYGSEDADEVRCFREFRDRVLMGSHAGRLFVEMYYLLSPRAAEFVSRRPLLRRCVKRLVLDPLFAALIKTGGKRRESLRRTS